MLLRAFKRSLTQMGTASGGHGTLIRDVMSSKVFLVADTDSAQRAAEIMSREDVGALPVTDSKGSRLTGFLTDRDVAVRLVAAGLDARSTLVESIKTKETPRYCFEDEPVDEVAQNMAEQQIRRLPVVSRDKRLVGVVALSDIATRAQFPAKAEVAGAALGGVAQHGGRHTQAAEMR